MKYFWNEYVRDEEGNVPEVKDVFCNLTHAKYYELDNWVNNFYSAHDLFDNHKFTTETGHELIDAQQFIATGQRNATRKTANYDGIKDYLDQSATIYTRDYFVNAVNTWWENDAPLEEQYHWLRLSDMRRTFE